MGRSGDGEEIQAELLGKSPSRTGWRKELPSVNVPERSELVAGGGVESLERFFLLA